MKLTLFPNRNQALADRLCMIVMEAVSINRDNAIKAYLQYKKIHMIHNPDMIKIMESEHEKHFLITSLTDSEGKN